MESVTQHPPAARPARPRVRARACRRLLAVALSLLVCAPIGATTASVRAAPATAAVHASLAARAHAPKAGTQQPEPAELPNSPSIQYEQAMEHAADAIEFEPGGRVTVPFRPRSGDDWKVDGLSPRALPAGHATGLQMRTSRGNVVWAAGRPEGLAGESGGPADGSGDGSPNDASGVAPASYSGSPGDDVSAAAPVGASGLRREVFGFLPYWEIGDSSTTLDWRTLSTVAYFSVGCLSSGYLDKYDADGSTTTGWGGWTSSKMTSIITAAHQNQTRVVLTISCFAWSGTGASRQASLLGSSTARSNLAKAAAAAIRDRGADGINLDFEPIVAGYSDEFTLLVRSIRSELNKIAPGYQLTFDTLGSIGNQPIAAATAPGGADAVFIMGYDYRTGSSPGAGSISPLTGPRYDLTDTVKAYTAKIPASKVILGVPYYGRAWSTSSDKLNATNISGTKYGGSAAPNYVDAYDLVASYGRRWDPVEQAPWTAYRKQTCSSTYGCVTSWRELYYDDAASLKLRYDLVNRSSLRGAGIWALGYDGTHPELRQAIADKFLSDKTPPVVGISTLAQSQRDEGFRVGWSAWDDSSIAGFDVQVAADGGAWTTWLSGTTLLSSIYLGTEGHVYAFRIRGTDMHGNVSPWYSAVSAAVTGVPASIDVGGFATVLVNGLHMRSTPSTGGAVMATLAAGDALRVVGGPVSGEGYAWYQVSGPLRQWAPVDALQVGGWVAVSGNGATNAGPRRPVYATRVTAGITNLTLNGGGRRFLTPNGDGDHDDLHLTWTNERTFDSLALRVYRLDGGLVGTVSLGGVGMGDHGWDWDGRVGGAKVPAGGYVLQLQGIDGASTFSAPSASPVSASQIPLTGVMVGDAAPTAVVAFLRPITPNRSATLTWKLTFGGQVAGLSPADFARTGTSTGCSIGTPTGSGATWSVTLTGCSAGTVTLALKPLTVVDAVRNWGPATQAIAGTLLIDRSAPVAGTPKVALRAGVNLPSTSTSAGILANLNLAGTDPGGAGVRSFEVRRSVDGSAFAAFASNVPPGALAVTLTPGHSYRFESRAKDNAGNVGGWVAGPLLRPSLTQQTSTAITWKGTWTKVSDARFSGGSVRHASSAGASASYSFTGRAIAWVTTVAANRGAAKVYLDGALVATIDLSAATTSFGRVAFARTWSSSGFHTLRVVLVGTAARPRVDIDALEVLR